MSTPDGAWQAVAIFGLPTVAVLTVTGYRRYGWARSLAVAAAIMLITGFVSWVVTIFVLASALSGSTIGVASGIVLYGIPALSVMILGLLALKILPARSSADRQFDHVSSG
jgi:multisubunit Na+/H+ antiporter MnhB subunit